MRGVLAYKPYHGVLGTSARSTIAVTSNLCPCEMG